MSATPLSTRDRLIARNRERSGYVAPLEDQFFAQPEQPKRKPQTLTAKPPRHQQRAKRANTTVYHLSCQVCAERFTAKRPEARYCSSRCSARAERQRRLSARVEREPAEKATPKGPYAMNCQHCGTAFTSIRPWAKYCSTVCRCRERDRKSAEGYIKKVFPPASCDQCGETYQPRNATAKYCSPRCRFRAASAAQLDRTRYVPVEKPCAWCGESFTAAKAKNTYCSDFCQGKAKRERRAQRSDGGTNDER